MTYVGRGATASVASWSYEEAFSRNVGLISSSEQERLRKACVAIAGLGGVGGVHAVTLARLGVGRFRLADPDSFEVGNFNRQYGAFLSTLGCNKAEVIAHVLLDINPTLEIQIYRQGVHEENVSDFLAGADLFIDGVDFFAVSLRQLLFREARRQRIWALTAGPVGFGVAWVYFDPDGMSFDDYFDIREEADPLTHLVAFALGLAPRAQAVTYLDVTKVDPTRQRAPSCGAACQLCAGVTAVEAMKVLLGRGPLRPAPYYHHFDPYLHRYVVGRLPRGNRSWRQRLKRFWAERRWRRLLAENPSVNERAQQR
jgi:tRNA A37 threonylcarbamoyladenosine dehydratase